MESRRHTAANSRYASILVGKNMPMLSIPDLDNFASCGSRFHGASVASWFWLSCACPRPIGRAGVSRRHPAAAAGFGAGGDRPGGCKGECRASVTWISTNSVRRPATLKQRFRETAAQRTYSQGFDLRSGRAISVVYHQQLGDGGPEHWQLEPTETLVASSRRSL